MTTFHLDLNAPSRTHDAVWAFGGSICHAPMLLRKDVRRHLTMCRDELGFRHVACRGMLGDEMSVLESDGSFCFDKIEPALDWLLETGLVPFLRLTEPRADSAGASRWAERVTALARHIDGRYGCDAREWFFEIAQSKSADVAAGPGPAAGLEAFEAIVRSIKDIHPEYRVGWHATGPERLDPFLSPATTAPEAEPANPRQCDFITADGGGDVAGIRQKLSAAWGQGTPLFILGWSGDDAGKRIYANDDCNRAAEVVRRAAELSAICQGVITRTISDIDALRQAQDPALRQAQDSASVDPFHDGRGLITVNDIRKSAFHALRLLHEHGGYHGQRLESHWTDAPPGLGCLPTRSESTLRLLFWFDRDAGASATTRFTIDGIPDSVSDAQVEVIRPAAGSAFEAWTQLGKPQFINREVLDTLELASLPAQASVNFREYPPRLEPGMVMQLTINLPYDD